MKVNPLFIMTFLSFFVVFSVSAQSKDASVEGQSKSCVAGPLFNKKAVLQFNLNKKQFENCMEKSQGNLEMVQCYATLSEKLKSMLDTKVNQIKLLLSQKSPESTDYAQAAVSFSKAQEAWLKFVKHDCAVLDNTFGSGSAVALASMDCETGHYADRLRSIDISSSFITDSE